MCVYVCTCMFSKTVPWGVTASPRPDCQLVGCLHNVLFDLVLATSLAECTSDTLPSFAVQSCGSHFIYWAFNFSQYGGWGVSLCLISLPQTIPLNKIKYHLRRKDLSTEDWIKQINGLVTFSFLFILLARLRPPIHIIAGSNNCVLTCGLSCTVLLPMYVHW